jgi:hypothetical protein
VLKKWLSWINVAIGGCAILLLLFAGLLTFQPNDVVLMDAGQIKRALPKSSFEMHKDACETIGNTCFALKLAPISLQLPDLRNQLMYCGKNGRPDAKADHTIFHFGFTGTNQIASISAKEKLYILYDRSRIPNQYLFSPNNASTPLWIEPEVHGNEALVLVRMKNDQGELITEPASFAE